MMRVVLKNIGIVFSVISIMLVCFACSSGKPIIDYGVEAVISEQNEDVNFSFEKDIDTKPKSNVQTKKD